MSPTIRSRIAGFISKYPGPLATLVAGLGGATLVVFNERQSREDVKSDLKEKIDCTAAKLENKIDQVHAENQFTQSLVLTSVVMTMKALDGDMQPIPSCVRAKSETY